MVTFFDVGQGDSALVQFPYGSTLLIDGGGGWKSWDMGTRVLIPELSRLGILRLDHVVLSHPDNDHALGLGAVLKWLKVGELWLHKNLSYSPKKRILAEIEQLSDSRGVKKNLVGGVIRRTISKVDMDLIPLGNQKSSRNDQALIVVLRFGKCQMLFTGDIEKESERELIERFREKFHLLKVPHHGSLTSSGWKFLSSISPNWAVISVGFKNTYGHPRKEVLNRYKSLGVQLFRTDFHGALRFTFTPSGEMRCESFLGDCGIGKCD